MPWPVGRTWHFAERSQSAPDLRRLGTGARHVFAAPAGVSDRRFIRLVAEDTTSLRFQFTAESKDGDRYEYVMETLLSLDKQTGTVSCELPGLATAAQEELDRCIAVRTGSDVTRVVQKLFEKQADLFPIRPQGGAYFVPAAHAAFVEQVQGFLGRVNGRLLRFPVPAGNSEVERSVRQTVADGLAVSSPTGKRSRSSAAIPGGHLTARGISERTVKVGSIPAYLARKGPPRPELPSRPTSYAGRADCRRAAFSTA